MENNNIFWVTLNKEIEITDPSREVCIINIGKNGEEMSREYFGNNPRIEINKDYNGK